MSLMHDGLYIVTSIVEGHAIPVRFDLDRLVKDDSHPFQGCRRPVCAEAGLEFFVVLPWIASQVDDYRVTGVDVGAGHVLTVGEKCFMRSAEMDFEEVLHPRHHRGVIGIEAGGRYIVVDIAEHEHVMPFLGSVV